MKQDFVFYRPLFKSVVVEIPGDYSGVPLKTALLEKRKKIQKKINFRKLDHFGAQN